MVTRFLPILLLVLATTGCFRDGYVCSQDTDCFDGEICSSGTCVNDDTACRPESDEALCMAASDCGALEIVDSCGTLRSLTCPCGDGGQMCLPDDVPTLCAAVDAACGMATATDTCGDERTFDCGPCIAPATCVDNTCVGCPDPVCDIGAECGVATNACGDTLDCGTCASDDICLDQRCTAPILQPAEVSEGDRFGERIKAAGDYLFIGAPGADFEIADNNNTTQYTDAGEIFVFRRTDAGWEQTQILRSPVPVSDDRFGRIFDARDDRLVVSSGDQLTTFERDPQGQYRFLGIYTETRDIADLGLVDRDQILVGLVDADGSSPTLTIGDCDLAGCSAASEFFEPPEQDGETGRLGLGYAIDTDGSFAIAGAPFDNDVEPSDLDAEGSSYLFGRAGTGFSFSPTGWPSGFGFFTRLAYDSAHFGTDRPGLEAGTSVTIRADGFALWGEPRATVENQTVETGKIFFINPDESGANPFRWRTALVGPTNQIYSRCGHSVALAGGNQAFVSCVYPASRDDTGYPAMARARTDGRIYRYEFDPRTLNWEIDPSPIVADVAAEFDHFGWTLEGTTDLLFIGAPGRDNDRGAVYIHAP